MDIKTYLARLQKITDNPDQFVLDAIVKSGRYGYVLNQYKLRMANVGPIPSIGVYKNSDGRRLGKRRAGGKRGRKTGNIKLLDTGAFYKGMFFTTDDMKIIVDSVDWKRDLLVDKYGENIFNLTDEEELFIFNEFVVKELNRQVFPNDTLEFLDF